MAEFIQLITLITLCSFFRTLLIMNTLTCSKIMNTLKLNYKSLIYVLAVKFVISFLFKIFHFIHFNVINLNMGGSCVGHGGHVPPIFGAKSKIYNFDHWPARFVYKVLVFHSSFHSQLMKFKYIYFEIN